MTGIEKILAKIEDDCKVICDDIITKAQVEAQVVLDNAKSVAEKAKQEALQEAKVKCQTDIELANSKAEHNRNKAILATKISIINEVINESMQKLKSLPDTDYFNVVMTLINRYAQNGCGVLRFSKKDLDRIPQGFENKLNEMFNNTEKSVKISSEPVSVDGGFVIVYDDIEQNCVFDSLLSDSLDDIKDELYEEIFMRESI